MPYTHDDIFTSDVQDLTTVLSDEERASILEALVGDDTDAIFDYLRGNESDKPTITDTSTDEITLESDYATYTIPVGETENLDEGEDLPDVWFAPEGSDELAEIHVGGVLTLRVPFNTLPEPVRDQTYMAVTNISP